MLGIVLAGGEGKRLYPLTADRAKPAVPFGGGYRLIDFVLSNLVNARYLRICVLTQYKSHSLDRHISQNWRLSGLAGSTPPVPAQQRLGPRWYTGSADAIYQSMNLIYDETRTTSSFSAPTTCTGWTPSRWCSNTSTAGRAPPSPASGCRARGLGIRLHRRRQVRPHPQFLENRRTRPPAPTIRTRRSCRWATTCSPPRSHRRDPVDADDDHSDHDMGGDIIPQLVADGMASVYDFNNNQVPGATRTRPRLLA